MSSKEEIEIEVLEFPEMFQIRPGMYVGDTDVANVLLREVVDNSIDELFASKDCDKISIFETKLKKENREYGVLDSGRGIPIVWDEKYEKTKANISISEPSAGSKFRGGDSTKIGMNGTGTKAVNALSDYYVLYAFLNKSRVESSSDLVKSLAKGKVLKNHFYRLEYRGGYYHSESIISKKDLLSEFGVESIDHDVRTAVRFSPSLRYYKSSKASLPSGNLSNLKLILAKFYNKELMLNTNMVLDITDFDYDHEIKSSIKIDQTNSPKNEKVDYLLQFSFSKDLSSSNIVGSVNSLVVNHPSSVHIKCVQNALKTAIGDVFGLATEYKNHLLKGLQCNIVFLATEVGFGSQTKEKLTDVDGWSWRSDTDIISEVKKYVKKNKESFNEHVERVKEYVKSMDNLSKKEFIKSKVFIAGDSNRKSSTLITSEALKDCSSKDRETCELEY